MLSDEQRQAGIAHFQQAIADARAAIAGNSSWFGFNSDEQAQDAGAVNIVANTVLPALNDLASQNTEVADAKFVDLAHTAEHQLEGIKGYSASVTFDSVIAATASATVQQTAQLAGQAVNAAAKVATSAASGLLSALPLSVKIGGALVLAGVAYVYLRPLLGFIPQPRAA